MESSVEQFRPINLAENVVMFFDARKPQLLEVVSFIESEQGNQEEFEQLCLKVYSPELVSKDSLHALSESVNLMAKRTRMSGEPYALHNLMVAEIGMLLAGPIYMSPQEKQNMFINFLLHDAIEEGTFTEFSPLRYKEIKNHLEKINYMNNVKQKLDAAYPEAKPGTEAVLTMEADIPNVEEIMGDETELFVTTIAMDKQLENAPEMTRLLEIADRIADILDLKFLESKSDKIPRLKEKFAKCKFGVEIMTRSLAVKDSPVLAIAQYTFDALLKRQMKLYDISEVDIEPNYQRFKQFEINYGKEITDGLKQYHKSIGIL